MRLFGVSLLDASPRVKRFILSVAVPLVVAVVGALFGTLLPIAAYEITHSETLNPTTLFGSPSLVLDFAPQCSFAAYSLTGTSGIVP